MGREELKVRSIGHCAMLEEDAMHIGTEADVSAYVLDISGRKTQLLQRHTNRNREEDGLR